MANILLVLPHGDETQLLERTLTDEGHSVRTDPNPMRGLLSITESWADLAIFDVDLVSADPADLIRMIRAVSDVQILAMIRSAESSLVVRLLDVGADDCLVKPLPTAELAARAKALVRRVPARDPSTLMIGDLEIDLRARTVHLDGISITFNRKEFELLSLLASNAGSVVSRRQIQSEVWPDQESTSSRTSIDVHLSWVRRKLGETAARPKYLHTVRGVGVKLVDPTGPDS